MQVVLTKMLCSFCFSIFHGVGCFYFQGRKQSFKLAHCLNSSSVKCFISIHRHNLPDDVLDNMLLQRQQLQQQLEEYIDDAYQSHISCARPPVGYLQCPLHTPEENCPPHIRLDQISMSDDVICTKSDDYEMVPREAYALLFVSSLNSGELLADSFLSHNILNQVHACHRPARTWFLKIDPLRIIGKCVYVCVCVLARGYK